MRKSRSLLFVLGVSALVLAACSGTNPTTTAGSNDSSARHTYVAIGENGSNGSRTRFDLRSLWPQLFYQSVIGTGGTFYDFTNPDQTIAHVISQVLPNALAVHPDLVTVWVSTADIVAGTTPSTYEDELRQLVRPLRKRGAIVLLADVAPAALDPAIGVCKSSGRGCQARLRQQPPANISAYDAVIASVARTTGARLVDIHSVLGSALRDSGLAGILATDQMSLSPRGAALVEMAFRAQLPKAFAKTLRSR
jgi:hypothetical protein